MFQIRFHGRGGQGVVSAAEMLSVAAFEEGMYAQAFPSFGSERTGAPVVSYCRISEKEIRRREPIMEPDVLIIQDPTLLHQWDVFSGLKDDGYILINTNKSLHDLGIDEIMKNRDPAKVCIVNATELSIKHVGRHVPNVPLLGGFAAITGKIKIESVIKAINTKFK
ncbi:MAG: 2-oxoacid:acceptor oxidoreductase family protein, partial [Spirochaetia bacterium]|nr:2-oxoacid:acceptor oxidoreductase family protein [Spirochaetia bacterium]